MEVTTHKVRIDLLPCVSQKRQKPAPLELCESEKKKREPLALCRSEKTKTGKTLPCVGRKRQKPEKPLAEDGAAPCCQASTLVL